MEAHVHFNQLTPAEAERLAILSEEMGECIQAIGKINRHGYESKYPPETGPTNRAKLEKELGDVMLTVYTMIAKKDIDPEVIGMRVAEKHETIKPYLHHQDSL